MKIEIKNKAKINRAYKRIPGLLEKYIARSLNKAADLVENKAKRKTPVDQGTLRRSIRQPRKANEGDKKTQVGTNIVYALRQHENLHYNHTTGEAKFLEKALEQNKRKINKIFQKELGNLAKDFRRLSK